MIKVRSYVASVKQCFKYFRSEHNKTICRSEERYVSFVEKRHTGDAINKPNIEIAEEIIDQQTEDS